MAPNYELDAVDRGILHLLQEDARNNSASMIATEVEVAPNTVRNRIANLEEAGIIQGYHPHIDYERAGYQLHVIFDCTVPIGDREELANTILGIEGVVEVTEILSGSNNLSIEVVGSDSDDMTEIATQIEAAGLTVSDERLVKRSNVQPFDHFGEDVVEE